MAGELQSLTTCFQSYPVTTTPSFRPWVPWIFLPPPAA